jgi:hypothetical protein
MLNFPHFSKSSFSNYILIIELSSFNGYFINFAYLLFNWCFDSNRLRDVNEIVDDGLMHETFDDVVLTRHWTSRSASRWLFVISLKISWVEKSIHMIPHLVARRVIIVDWLVEGSNVSEFSFFFRLLFPFSLNWHL